MAVPTFPSPEEAVREDGFVQAGRTRVYWQRFVPPAPRASVAVLHGGGDHSGRYAGITSALVRAGFAVALPDFRGHGRSDGRRWYVERFEEYVEDLDAFWPKARRTAAPAFVVAHSQGALVAIAWALAARRDAAGFVLSSPYLKLSLAPPRLKVLGAQLAGRVVPWLPVKTGIRAADLTSDEEMQRWTDADPLYGRATTPAWFNASRRAQAEAMARARDFSYPLLVLTGGSDPIADPAASRAFVAACGSADRTLREHPGLRHEVFNERTRERTIADAVAWLAERAPREGAKAIDASRA